MPKMRQANRVARPAPHDLFRPSAADDTYLEGIRRSWALEVLFRSSLDSGIERLELSQM